MSVQIDRDGVDLKVSFADLAGNMAGKEYRFEASRRVEDLIDRMQNDMGYASIVFYDGSQRVPRSHEIARYCQSQAVTVAFAAPKE